MVRKQLKNQIITLLKVNPNGLSQKSIAEGLNAARATIRKYLRDLELEGKASLVPAGEFKVWIYNKEDQSADELFQFWIKSINGCILSFKKVSSNYIDYKELGNEFGKRIPFGEMLFKLNLLQVFPLSELSKGFFPALLAFCKMLLSLIIRYLGEGELDPPTIFESEQIFSYRIRNFKFEDLSFFPFLGGFLETQIFEEQGIAIGVNIDINQPEKIIDIKVQLQHDKEYYEENET